MLQYIFTTVNNFCKSKNIYLFFILLCSFNKFLIFCFVLLRKKVPCGLFPPREIWFRTNIFKMDVENRYSDRSHSQLANIVTFLVSELMSGSQFSTGSVNAPLRQTNFRLIAIEEEKRY